MLDSEAYMKTLIQWQLMPTMNISVCYFMFDIRATLYSEWSAALLIWSLQKYNCEEIADV